MTLLRKLSFLFFVPLLTVLFSCSARIDGVVREGGAADLSLKTALEPRTMALIRSFRGFAGETADEPVLDGPAIGRSMAAASGLRSVSLRNTSPSALEGTISISNVGDFLSAGGSRRFITYTEGRTAGTSSIVIVLERDSAPELISRLSPEVEDYLSVLMAPAVTGEVLTRQGYFDLLASVYSKALADEIAAARVRAYIDFPRPLTAVRGGTIAGRRAEFDIPLADLLVLEHPLRYEASW